MTKGRINWTRGILLPSSGSAFYCHLLLKSVSSTSKKALVNALNMLVSRLSNNYHYNKELPTRSVASAHWSGPFVTVR
jgi:hypothetical protein